MVAKLSDCLNAGNSCGRTGIIAPSRSLLRRATDADCAKVRSRVRHQPGAGPRVHGPCGALPAARSPMQLRPWPSQHAGGGGSGAPGAGSPVRSVTSGGCTVRRPGPLQLTSHPHAGSQHCSRSVALPLAASLGSSSPGLLPKQPPQAAGRSRAVKLRGPVEG
jgi:hypothetical protein